MRKQLIMATLLSAAISSVVAAPSYTYRLPVPGLVAQPSSTTPATPPAPPQGIKLSTGTRTYADGSRASSCLAYLSGTGSHAYTGDTGSGQYSLNYGSGSLNVYCDMTFNGGGWTLVRRTNQGLTWAPVNDNASGTAAYGTYVPNPQAPSTFSIAYSNLTYKDVLFATGDAAKWVIAPKTSVSTITGSCTTKVPVLASHISSTAYSVAWCLRSNQVEDPWISVYDHGSFSNTSGNDSDTNSMLYGENGTTGWSYWLNNRGGANVFVR